jgi:tRNA threonylcarbamoyladenosine biosynthesis protein TsaE
MRKELFLKDEQATLHLGAWLADRVPEGFTIYLAGNLGSGKTTIVRGFLRALGYDQAIKSPTYTLVESYDIAHDQYVIPIHHFDLYRVVAAEELELIGMRDYFSKNAICLVEWPEKAGDYLLPPDLFCQISLKDTGRLVDMRSDSPNGKKLLNQIGHFDG